MNRLYLISLFVVVLAFVGCQKEPAVYAPSLPDMAMDAPRVVMPEQDDDGIIEIPRSMKEQVLENCLLVQASVERFAAENGGRYPYNTADATPAGDTLIDLLPGGMLLENPFHHHRTEPVDGAAAVPGQTGYMCAVNSQGNATGYLITGYGLKGEIVQICKDPYDD